MSLSHALQFGNVPTPSSLSDQLEHYRLEISKLQRINLLQKEGYEKKIAALEQTIRQGGFNLGHNRGYTPVYTPAADINNEIVKRDREINKLSEENERLRKNYVSNPDTQLIKRREIFDQVADKDAQIMKLKKTIYELQAKYDGKYFNDTRMRNEYDLLLQENKKLRKQMEINYNTYMNNKRQSNEVSTQLLEGIRYKKQYDLILRENQLLKNQYKKLVNQTQAIRQYNTGKINSGADMDMLRYDLNQSNIKNRQLIGNMQKLENENNMLRTQNSQVVPVPVPIHVQQQYTYNQYNQPYKNAETLPNSPQRYRRPQIFKHDSKHSSPSNPSNIQPNVQPNQTITPPNQHKQLFQTFDTHPQSGPYVPSPYPIMTNYEQQYAQQPKKQYPQLAHQQSYPTAQQYQPQQPHPPTYQQPFNVYNEHQMSGNHQRQDSINNSNFATTTNPPNPNLNHKLAQVQPPQKQMPPFNRQSSYDSNSYDQPEGAQLSKQQQNQLKKFSQASVNDRDMSSDNSRNGADTNQGFILQDPPNPNPNPNPKLQHQSSGSAREGLPKTEKKRSLYDKFNIDQVTKNVVLELPKLVDPSPKPSTGSGPGTGTQ